MLSFVRSLNWETKVLGLNISQLGQLNIDVSQMQSGHLLVENFGQDIDAHVELAGLSELRELLAESSVGGLEEQDLSENLVGEGAGHDEGGVARGTAEIDQTAFGEKEDTRSAGHGVSVNLGLDVLDALGVLLEPGYIDFNIEMTNI